MPLGSTNQRFFLLIVDVIGYLFSFAIIAMFDFVFRDLPDIRFEGYVSAYLLLMPIWFLGYYMFDLYSKMMNKDQINILKATIISVLINFIVAFFLFHLFENFTVRSIRTNLVFAFCAAFSVLMNRRIYFKKYLATSERVRILLISSVKQKEILENELKDRPALGYKIMCHIEGCDVSEKLNEKLAETKFDCVLVDRSAFLDKKNVKNLLNCLSNGIEVYEFSDFLEKLTRKVFVDFIEESWFLNNSGFTSTRIWDKCKNIGDRILAFALLCLLAPVFSVVALISFLTMGFPIFFTQTRTGYLGNPFTIYKFRSMTKSAEKDGAKWATPSDSRVTPWGKVLRKTRLDELPQLLNIIKGDMNFVGPRPERPEFTKELSEEIRFFNERNLVKPGLTGWAQVSFRYGYSVSDSLEKLQYDLYYIKNRSLVLDFAVILKTIRVVILGSGQ